MRRLLSISLAFFMVVLLLSGCVKQQTQTPEPSYRTATQDVFSFDNGTVYFLMTDRFLDGNPDNNAAYGRVTEDALGNKIATFNGGDVVGITKKLEEGYFDALGVNVLWISAPYEQVHGYIGGGRHGEFAHYGFHGYYALDWTMMDRSFGTVEEFRTFVDTAHGKGIRVILDVVMNHVGYPNLQDMLDYGYGGLPMVVEGAEPNPDSGESFHKWTELVQWDDYRSWTSWWGSWVRSDRPGYEAPGEGVIDQTLAGLPDIRTELTEDVGLAPILKTKWALEAQEGGYEPWILPSTVSLRQDLGLAPADYIVSWLAAWVEEFGIDGFRIDTAKHVEIERWAQLKEATNAALWRFRENNPDNPAATFTDDFYFVGEVWGQGVARNYYFDHGFDALINFAFQGLKRDGPAFSPDRMPRIFQNYAEAINKDPSFNVLSYISQHDTTLYPREKLIQGGTYLLLLPGMVKIFYGDETARLMGDGKSDGTMGTRSPMNWDSMDLDVLAHFQKLGAFRNRNLAVGAGSHETHSVEPFIFSRHYVDETKDLQNRVMVYYDHELAKAAAAKYAVGTGERVTGVTVALDVTAIAGQGSLLRDAYTGKVYTVSEGLIDLEVDPMGLALLEEVFSEVLTHP